MERVLVTGASGFIGSHCIIALLNQGYLVRGTIRNMDRAEGLRNIIKGHTQKIENLEFVQTDLMKDTGWDLAVKDCTYVLHVASPVPIKLPENENEVIGPAKEGTLRVLKACENAAVKRVVITSSIAAICAGYPKDKVHFDEKDWSVLDGTGMTAYPKSKTIAEKAAWEFIENSKSSLEMVAINPCVVLGPALEKDFGSSLELIRKIMAGEVPGNPKIGWALVDVRDVVKLQLLAMIHDKAPGNRFVCANEPMWMQDIAKNLKDHFPEYKKKISTRELPDFMVKIAGLFDPTVKAVLSELGTSKVVSSNKAKNMLGWTSRSNREAIIAAGESLVEFGVV